MSANHASIKLSRDFVDAARLEADTSHRSVGAQVEHWAKIGRALESTPGIGLDRIRATLEGRMKLEDLSAVERDAFHDQLSDAFNAPNQRVDDAYAAMGRREAELVREGRLPPAARRRAG